MADDRRFCTAPSFARPSLMVLIAASSLSRALTAFAWVSKLMVADPAVSTGVPASGTTAVTVLTAPSWISRAAVVALDRRGVVEGKGGTGGVDLGGRRRHKKKK